MGSDTAMKLQRLREMRVSLQFKIKDKQEEVDIVSDEILVVEGKIIEMKKLLREGI